MKLVRICGFINPVLKLNLTAAAGSEPSQPPRPASRAKDFYRQGVHSAKGLQCVAELMLLE